MSSFTTSSLIVSAAGWLGLNRFARLVRMTQIGEQITTTVSYAVTRLTPEQADAKALLTMWRGR